MKSRQKNWRESRSRETEVGEKIAVTTSYLLETLSVLYKLNQEGKLFKRGNYSRRETID